MAGQSIEALALRELRHMGDAALTCNPYTTGAGKSATMLLLSYGSNFQKSARILGHQLWPWLKHS